MRIHIGKVKQKQIGFLPADRIARHRRRKIIQFRL